jgi:hypothetical protein
LSIVCCLFSVAWIFLDPLAPRSVATFFETPAISSAVDLGAPSSRLMLVRALSSLALVSVVMVALGLLLGPPRHRGVRSWLALTAVVAFWLGLTVTWRSLAAAGQQWRLSQRLDSFDSLATQLQTAWPASDGYLAKLGAFNAYPIGHPRTLLIIAAEQEADSTPVAAVERSDAGALRFELAGDETGVWLERHPPGSQPASFTGGLQDERELVDAVPLKDGWYLSHYRTGHGSNKPPASPQENG